VVQSGLHARSIVTAIHTYARAPKLNYCIDPTAGGHHSIIPGDGGTTAAGNTNINHSYAIAGPKR
jgi:hypothetical protein